MKKLMMVLLHILLTVFVAFEYFVFLWLWSGDGLFTLLGCGISYMVYFALHIMAICKAPDKYKIIIYSAVILTPILSVATVYCLLAPMFGISISVV